MLNLNRFAGLDEPELKIIGVFIYKLRKKLVNASQSKNDIETLWGRGYLLHGSAPELRALASRAAPSLPMK